jgi:hypothetical protein
MNEVATPAFLRGRSKFTAEEVLDAREKSARRYMIEVLYSRTSVWRMLRDRVPMSHLKYANDVWWWAHGISNLRKPVAKVVPK